MPPEPSLSPPQARQELNPSHVSAYLRIKREPQEVEDTCISWRFSQGICRADNQKHIITYIKETHRKSLVHNREGKCLVRSSQDHNLERGGDDSKLKGCKPETNLLERQPKRDLVPMRICAKPYIMSERIKSFPKGQTKHGLNH